MDVVFEELAREYPVTQFLRVRDSKPVCTKTVDMAASLCSFLT